MCLMWRSKEKLLSKMTRGYGSRGNRCGFWGEEDFWFVEFEEFGLNPGLYVCEAAGEGGGGSGCDGSGGDVDLRVVGVAVEVEAVVE